MPLYRYFISVLFFLGTYRNGMEANIRKRLDSGSTAAGHQSQENIKRDFELSQSQKRSKRVLELSQFSVVSVLDKFTVMADKNTSTMRNKSELVWKNKTVDEKSDVDNEFIQTKQIEPDTGLFNDDIVNSQMRSTSNQRDTHLHESDIIPDSRKRLKRDSINVKTNPVHFPIKPSLLVTPRPYSRHKHPLSTSESSSLSNTNTDLMNVRYFLKKHERVLVIVLAAVIFLSGIVTIIFLPSLCCVVICRKNGAKDASRRLNSPKRGQKQKSRHRPSSGYASSTTTHSHSSVDDRTHSKNNHKHKWSPRRWLPRHYGRSRWYCVGDYDSSGNNLLKTIRDPLYFDDRDAEMESLIDNEITQRSRMLKNGDEVVTFQPPSYTGMMSTKARSCQNADISRDHIPVLTEHELGTQYIGVPPLAGSPQTKIISPKPIPAPPARTPPVTPLPTPPRTPLSMARLAAASRHKQRPR